MAAIRGTEGVIQIDGSNNLASVRSFTLDTTQDTIETTAMGNDSRVFVKGLRTFTGSADVILDDTNPQHGVASSPIDFFANSPSGSLKLYPEGSTTGDIEVTGSIIVTGYSINSTYDGIVEASVSFQGTGDATYGTKS